ncbi:hypothetical protein CPB83DRAFT_857277, partial [Crepidotus variabilis]
MVLRRNILSRQNGQDRCRVLLTLLSGLYDILTHATNYSLKHCYQSTARQIYYHKKVMVYRGSTVSEDYTVLSRDVPW